MMTEPNEIRNDFLKKLDQIASDHKDELDEELKGLQDSLSKFDPKMAFHELQNEIAVKESGFKKEQFQSPPPLPQNRQALINITSSNSLKTLDDTFFSYFSLGSYLPYKKLSYPTIYCVTLEEFFTPFFYDVNLSEQSRSIEMNRLIEEARQTASENHGGIFGVNFPGQGCYINGWLFGELSGIDPQKIPENPEIYKKVLATAAHEKLGHGFISVYSSLGQIKSRLGLTLVEMASNFGLHIADDPIIQLRQQQSDVLFYVSQFLEEGWATWIENFIKEKYLGYEIHSNYNLQTILNISSYLPENTRESFVKALGILFSSVDVSLGDILDATHCLAFIGKEYNELISNLLSQPLRYAIGKLLCDQCADNFGSDLVPYAVLTAANITFDPQQISLADLKALLTSDPRLNPDARLAAISKIRLEGSSNLEKLVNRINNDLSFSIPPEIRK